MFRKRFRSRPSAGRRNIRSFRRGRKTNKMNWPRLSRGGFRL